MQLNQASTEFLEGYFSTHERRRKTKSAYRSDLAQFQEFAGKDIGIQSLSSSVIECWAGDLRQKGYSPASIRRKIVTLRVFCSYWVRKGALPESPFWRVKLCFGRIEQLPRTLTEEEIRSILAQARKNWSDVKIDQPGAGTMPNQPVRSSSQEYRAFRNLAMVDLLFATGMRVGEASTLDVSDFFVREAFLRIQGKGGRDRLAFIVDEQTVQTQRGYLETRLQIETQSQAIFLNASGERLSTQGIANIIAQLSQGAGVKRHVTPHMLRHTVATLLLRNGVDIRVVQEFLGHTSIITTQRYTHITKEHLIGELRKSHPSLKFRTAPC